jgi:GDP-L-fucose synthase
MNLDKSSKIYIAGHRGLVGSALVRMFEAKGYAHLILRTSKELDLRNQSEVLKFFEDQRPDTGILAAAKVGGILANSTYKAEFIYDNLAIATNVIHASYLTGVKRLLNLGSSCIYPKMAPQPLKEDSLLTGPLEETNEPYAIAKIAALKLCRYYNEQYKTNFLSLMPTNMYGPNDNFNLETAHVLPAMLRKMYLGLLLSTKSHKELLADAQRHPLGFGIKPPHSVDTLTQQLKGLGITAEVISLWGTGTPRREFMHVDDLAEASLFILNKTRAETGELVNVGVGDDLTIKELAAILRAIVGYQGEVRFAQAHPDGTPRKLLDVGKLTRLGWKAAIPLEQGIRKWFAWYKEPARLAVQAR